MAEAPDGRGYNAFTAELRLIQEVQRAAKDVPWLTINHLQILLTIFDMETPQGLETQSLADVTDHHKSTVNRIIHSLGDARGRGSDKKDGLGLIRVETDVNDKRIRRIFLTAYGKRLKNLLLNVAGPDDHEAGALAAHQRAIMFGSDQRAEPQHHVLEAEVIKAGNVEIQPASLKVVRKHVGKLIEKQLGPQSASQLERSLRRYSNTMAETIKYRGAEVPLITHQEARELVKKGELFRGNSLGVWMYYDQEDFEEKQVLPKYIQEDWQAADARTYAFKLAKDATAGNVSVEGLLGEIPQVFNAHQSKSVIDLVIKRLGRARLRAMEDAVKSMEQANTELDKADDLLKRQKATNEAMEAHGHMMKQSFGNPNREQHHYAETMKAAEASKVLGEKVDVHLEAGAESREKADKMKALEKQMAQMMAMMQDLKNDE